jgi:bacteriocin biosynthesis cyclodehydratase domain-containing protein
MGAFGSAVAAYLRTLRSDTVETIVVDRISAPLDSLPTPHTNVLAAWRPVPSMCELLDRESHQSRLTFIPLILESAVLRLGPIVVRGEGTCWDCWARRSKQHSVRPKEAEAVLRHYASDPSSGPQGFLEPFALLGAARVSQIIDAITSVPRSLSAMAGSIWQIDIMTREVMRSTVVGVHGCLRCGLRRSEATRSFTDLRRELAYLWETTSIGGS